MFSVRSHFSSGHTCAFLNTLFCIRRCYIFFFKREIIPTTYHNTSLIQTTSISVRGRAVVGVIDNPSHHVTRHGISLRTRQDYNRGSADERTTAVKHSANIVGVIQGGYIFYAGASLAGVSCRRRWPRLLLLS